MTMGGLGGFLAAVMVYVSSEKSNSSLRLFFLTFIILSKIIYYPNEIIISYMGQLIKITDTMIWYID